MLNNKIKVGFSCHADSFSAGKEAALEAIGKHCSRKLKIHQFRKLVITQAAGLNYVISK